MDRTWSRCRRALPLIALLLAAPTVWAEQLPITRFSIADGLPHSRVMRVLQDSRGFIWFCTGEGLSRFDGYGFTNYQVENGLPYASLNDILETDDGEYWIATNGGGVVLFRPDPPRPSQGETSVSWFTSYSVAEDAGANRVNVFYRDTARRLWVGTDGGLFLLERKGKDLRFRPVPLGLPDPDQAVQVWAMEEDAEGTLWIGTRFGLVRRAPDGRLHQYRVSPRSTTDHVWALLFDRDGRLWIGHQIGLIVFKPDRFGERRPDASSRTPTSSLAIAESGPSRRLPLHGRVNLPADPGAARRFTAADGFPTSVTALVQSSSGSIWVGSRGRGIAEFVDGRFRPFTRENGLFNTLVLSITEDRGGNIWIGTLDGAMRIALTGFVTYAEPDGIGEVTGVLFEKDGWLYAASYDFRISRFDGQGFTTVRPRFPPSITGWRSNHGALLDRFGEWWMSTREGLYRFPRVARLEDLARTAPRAVYTMADGLADNDVTLLFEDRRGDIWIGHFAPGDDVLTRWERATGRFHRYSSRHGLAPRSALMAIAESPAGDLWMGFRGGELVRYSEGRFHVVFASGVSPPRSIGALHFDSSGRLWVAVHAGGGLLRLDTSGAAAAVVTQYTTAQGLTNNNTSCLTQDQRGRIYVVTGAGIDRFDPASGQVTRYSEADGVSNTECSMALRDSRGSLWFNTAKGMLRLIPGHDPELTPPRILIGRVQVAGADEQIPALGVASLGPVTIPSGRNRVEIDYFALSEDLRRLPRYQYRLEGGEDDWSPPTRQRQITYANLSAGTYRFAVRAIDADGTPSVAPAVLDFKVLAPVWQRWWFVSAVSGLLIIAAYTLHRRRVARVIELERVRTRIATDLHDEVGSGLSQVSVLSEIIHRRVGADPSVAEPLSTIGAVSRDLVDSMNDIVWAINPARDHLTDLSHRMRRFASELLGAGDVSVHFDVPDSSHDMPLGADVRREVWLIFKEAVNNIVRHSACTRVDIALRVRHAELELRIADDGRGFDINRREAGEGNGLVSMRRRATRIGGSIEITSGIGRGTVVTCRAPARRRTWQLRGTQNQDRPETRGHGSRTQGPGTEGPAPPHIPVATWWRRRK